MIAAASVLSVLAALAVVKTFEQRIPPVAVRIGLLVFVLGPLAGLMYAMWALWQWALQPIDLLLLVVFAVVTGLGTSLGYHRLLTHRSFQTTPCITAMALAAGAMAVPSRPIDWAARHLEHHAIRTARSTGCSTLTSAGCSASAPPSASATAAG